MWVGAVEEARRRAAEYLAARDEPERALYRAEHGAPDPGARRWLDRLLDRQDPDGSWAGDLGETAQTLLTLDELRRAGSIGTVDPAIGEALDWMRARQNAPGRVGDGCTEERHAAGTCQHFLAGFFSPAGPDVAYDRLLLRTGSWIEGQANARLAASCLAVRAFLCWGRGGHDVELHLEGLRRLLRPWTQGEVSPLSSGAILCVLAALDRAGGPANSEAMAAGLSRIRSRQRGDGSWEEADLFQTLALLEAVLAGDESSLAAVVEPTVRQTAHLLVSTQAEDGSWGGGSPARRALVAWRALRWISETGPARPEG